MGREEKPLRTSGTSAGHYTPSGSICSEEPMSCSCRSHPASNAAINAANQVRVGRSIQRCELSGSDVFSRHLLMTFTLCTGMRGVRWRVRASALLWQNVRPNLELLAARRRLREEISVSGRGVRPRSN